MSHRAGFVCGDWAAALAGPFDLVLCNPPYIPTSEIDSLMPEVARFEPRAALDGGADGYAAYRRLVPDLPGLLAPDGTAVLEVGVGQAAMVAELAGRVGFASDLRRDLSGIERALVLRVAMP
jgi:release factor glutamine methyltransferase